MFEIFTSQTGTIFNKQFVTIEGAEKYARNLGIDCQIFKVKDPFTVQKWIFAKKG